jgi:PAS domain S-box-containing protein
MNEVESERDYYRQQTNELGMRVLRLQEEQTRTRREARRNRIIATLIREVYQLADSHVSQEDIGQQFLYVILETLNADRAALLTYLPEQGCFVAEHTLGYSKTTPLPNFTPPSQPEAYHFVNSRSAADPLLDYLRQVAGGPYLLWAFNPKASLALLVSNNTEDQHLHRPFEAADRDIVEGALSVFIEISQRKQVENKLLRTATLQTLLYQILRTISGQLNQDAIAHLTVRAIARFTDWPHICFATPNEAGTHWVVRAAGGELRAEVGLICPINQGVVGRTFRTNQTQLVKDIRTDPDYRGECPTMLSELAVPIRQGEHVLAVLNLESDKPATFGPEEVQLAKSIAEAIALSLENARLFEAVQVELAERRRIEAALQQSEVKHRTLVEQIPAVTYLAALDEVGTILYISPQIEILSGFSMSEWRENPDLWLKQIHPDDQDRVLAEVSAVRAANKPILLEYRLLTKAGRIVWVRDEAKVMYNGANQPACLQGIIFDVTAHKLAEEQIKTSLQEKEVLLKEIHHRVKNNLQVIASLLNLQANYIQDAQAQEVFRDSQNRVRSMALIHEKLYRSENLAQIDFGDYIQELAAFLFRAQNAHEQGITLNLHTDRTLLDIEKAVPCGLIINELVSNTLKHAFPNGRTGEVRVEVHTNGHNQLNLVVADDGVGFPAEVDFQATESLGLQLVNTLTDQLDGTISLERQPGTRFSISFPAD